MVDMSVRWGACLASTRAPTYLTLGEAADKLDRTVSERFVTRRHTRVVVVAVDRCCSATDVEINDVTHV